MLKFNLRLALVGLRTTVPRLTLFHGLFNILLVGEAVVEDFSSEFGALPQFY